MRSYGPPKGGINRSQGSSSEGKSTFFSGVNIAFYIDAFTYPCFCRWGWPKRHERIQGTMGRLNLLFFFHIF